MNAVNSPLPIPPRPQATLESESPRRLALSGSRWDTPSGVIEPLELRIAPSAVATTAFVQMNPIAGTSAAASWASFDSGADFTAAPLSPGSIVLPAAPEVFTSEHPGFVIDTKVTEFLTPGSKGTIESLVVRRTATTDPVELPVGGLDFYYQVTLTSGDPRTAVATVTLGLFDPYLIEAGYDGRVGPIVSSDPLDGRDGGTQSPVLFSESAGTVQFDFVSQTLDEAITLGQPLSSWLVLRTNARSYDEAGSAGIVGSIAGVGTLSTTASIFAPADTEPQPRALVVTGAGVGSLVQVFDPATGALQESFHAFGARNKCGVRVATGDVNGDGVEDIIVGSGRNKVGGAQVRVFDGADPAHPPLQGVLGNFKPFGAGFVGAVNVAAGDVNGDGRADIVIAPASGSSGQVRIFSGLDGSLITKFTALFKVNGGVRVAAGDLDGDGRDEVIVGAGIGSAVRVFDGLSGSPVPGMTFHAFGKGYSGGVNVAAGDVNGDGIDEIVVGAGAKSDRIAIFDHTLTKLAELRTNAAQGVRVAAADVNGDGFDDIIAGRGTGGSTAVIVLSGISSDKLFELSGYNPGGRDGSFVG